MNEGIPAVENLQEKNIGEQLAVFIKQFHPDQHMGLSSKTFKYLEEFNSTLIAIRNNIKENNGILPESWEDIGIQTASSSKRRLLPIFTDGDTGLSMTLKKVATPADFLTEIRVVDTQTNRQEKAKNLRHSRMPDGHGQYNTSTEEPVSNSPFRKSPPKSGNGIFS